MPAVVKFRGKTLEVEAGTKVEDVLAMMGLSREGVIARVGTKLVTEDYRLRDGETLELISAISGG
ncbi:MAG: MoaD/ThiS family protein [Euryarchaeota archaeon]|nr:MoaD/ThiS family protein [Euryarchaeota archaeon]